MDVIFNYIACSKQPGLQEAGSKTKTERGERGREGSRARGS